MSSLHSPEPTLKKLVKQLRQLEEALDGSYKHSSLQSLTALLEKRTEKEDDGGQLESGRLESAQLQSSLTYVLLDLVWILLKVCGHDVQQHPITAELKRVQHYLVKVHKIDKGIDERKPSIDAEKAKRFVVGALGSSEGKRTIFAEDGSIASVEDAGGRRTANSKEEGWTIAKQRRVKRTSTEASSPEKKRTRM